MADSFSSVAGLKAFKPRPSPYEVKDDTVTGGYVRVLTSGAMSYVFRYRFRNKPHKLFLGRFNPDNGGLADARKKAREAADKLMAARNDPNGVDPVAARQAARRVSTDDLVETVVESFIEHYAKPHLKDWKETTRILNKEIVGRWRGRRLSSLTTAEIRAAIREIGARAPIGANRTLARFKKLCNWAVEQEIIATSPAAMIKSLTPEKGRARERALEDSELAVVWRAAEGLGFPFGPIVQLLILTGQRRGEVSGMVWGEIDLKRALWTIPATRSKNGLTHTVALTKPVLDILKSLPRFDRDRAENDYVFSSGSTPPSGFSKAKSRLDQRIAEIMGDESLDAFVVHDLRRSVATGMARLGIALPVIEKCLNHVSGSFGGIVGVYQRHSFAEEMRDAHTRWTTHISNRISAHVGDDIVTLGKVNLK